MFFSRKTYYHFESPRISLPIQQKEKSSGGGFWAFIGLLVLGAVAYGAIIGF